MALFRKNTATEPVYAAYAVIVAQSRRPFLYADWGVPDTVTGRFDMINLHMALFFRRLRNEGDKAKAFSQAVFDLFLLDMDRSIRELGASDLGVPKRVHKMNSAFFGLLTAVNEAIDAGDQPLLERVVARNIFDGEPAPGVAPLATYLLAESERLDSLPLADLLAGRHAAPEAA